MKRRMAVLVSGLCFLMVIAGSVVQGADYSHEVKVRKMSFSWRINGDRLAIKLTAETTGWVGIGFNPSDEMKDANFVLGYVKKGKARLTDEFGIGETKHSSDKKLGGSNEAVLVSGTEKSGVTTVEFTIPLHSGDKYDSEIKVDGDTVVLLAYGPGRDSFRTRHKYRTALKINLATGASSSL
jgi:hypothetical protein